MTTHHFQSFNTEAREAWDANAQYWDAYMADRGNDFVNVLIWPATLRLLQIAAGERVLDAGCGNGLYARRLARLGAEVVAFDFAPDMIRLARSRTAGAEQEQIAYHVLDATDEAALVGLGAGSYDAAICQMALFDMAAIDPLLRALNQLLRPGGRFILSVMHPCFNGNHAVHIASLTEQNGQTATQYGLQLRSYLSSQVERGVALRNQTQMQLYFHRPLQVLFGSCFRAGFMLDALEEPAFPPDHPHGSSPLAWGGNYSEFPPVLIARLRKP